MTDDYETHMIGIDDLPEGARKTVLRMGDLVTRIWEVSPATEKCDESAVALKTTMKEQPACIARRVAGEDIVFVKDPLREIRLMGKPMFGLPYGAVHPFLEDIHAKVDPAVTEQRQVYFTMAKVSEPDKSASYHIEMPGITVLQGIRRFGQATVDQQFYMGVFRRGEQHG